MTPARRCRLCGLITPSDFCSCRGITIQIHSHRIADSLGLDMTLSLNYDSNSKLFVLVQKPSGQHEIPLQQKDILRCKVKRQI